MTVIDEVADLELIIMLYNNIAMLYKVRGEYDLSIEFYHKALIICKETGNDNGISIVSSNLGLLYEKQEKYQLALEYLSESLEIRRLQNNLRGEAIVLNNLGVVYEGLKQYEKALDCYYQSLKINKKRNQLKSVGRIYNNIGIIYKNMGMLDSAYVNYNKSLELRYGLNDSSGLSHTYTNIGILKKLENKYNSAINYFIDAAEISEKENDLQGLVRIYKELYSSYSAIEDYKNAFEYSYKYQLVYDSIYNLNSRKYIEEVEGKYQNLKKEKENQALLSDNLHKDEQLKKQVIIGFLIIILAILILVVLFVVIKSKSKLQLVNNLLSQKNIQIENKRSKLKSANEELIKLGLFKEDMTNMLIHDLKNPLSNIINIDIFSDTDSMIAFVKQAGFKMMNLVQNMLDVYKYESAELVLNKTKNKIESLIKEAIVDVDFLANQKSLKFDFINLNAFFVYCDAELTRRILVNILSNAVKFSPKKGEVSLSAKVSDNDMLRISICNQGPGIPKHKQNLIFERFGQAKQMDLGKFSSTGLGLTFCKMAVEAHNGELGVISESETGVEFWFTLPDYQVNKAPLENEVFVAGYELNLTTIDKEYLKPFINQIKDFNIFEISSINSVLKSIDKKNPNINNWVEKLTEVLYSGNEVKYNQLINF